MNGTLRWSTEYLPFREPSAGKDTLPALAIEPWP